MYPVPVYRWNKRSSFPCSWITIPVIAPGICPFRGLYSYKAMSHHGFAGGISEHIAAQADESPREGISNSRCCISPLFPITISSPCAGLPGRSLAAELLRHIPPRGFRTVRISFHRCVLPVPADPPSARSLRGAWFRSGCRGAGYLVRTRKLSAPSVSSTRSAGSFGFFHQAVTRVTAGYNFPSLPKNGELLMPKSILMVGSSTLITGINYSGNSRVAYRISPMLNSSNPTIAQISPACTSVTFFLPALQTYTVPFTFDLRILPPALDQGDVLSFFDHPLDTLPTAMRPRKEGIIQRGDLHLRGPLVHPGLRNMFRDGIHQREDIFPLASAMYSSSPACCFRKWLGSSIALRWHRG